MRFGAAQGSLCRRTAEGKSHGIIASAFGMALAAAVAAAQSVLQLRAEFAESGATDIIRLFLILGLAFIEFLR